MDIYLYQNWSRSYKKIRSEEWTINYYLNHVYKPRYNPNLGDVEVQKQAHKFLKTCTDPEQWAMFAYQHDLQFEVCKMDGAKVEANLYQDVLKDIGVCFLDDDNDVYMIYTFRKQNNGKYFLIAIAFWEWTDDKQTDEDYSKFWKYWFEPNGSVKVIEWEKGAEEECVWTSKRPLNVESNWEDRPEFGDWQGFFTLKRWEEGELDEAFQGKPLSGIIYQGGKQIKP